MCYLGFKQPRSQPQLLFPQEINTEGSRNENENSFDYLTSLFCFSVGNSLILSVEDYSAFKKVYKWAPFQDFINYLLPTLFQNVLITVVSITKMIRLMQYVYVNLLGNV